MKNTIHMGSSLETGKLTTTNFFVALLHSVARKFSIPCTINVPLRTLYGHQYSLQPF